MAAAGSSVTLEDVLITPELTRRPARPPDYEGESRALAELAVTMADSPKLVFQKLAECALALCRAGSAGISVREAGVEEVFRWRATAGDYAQYLGGTLPRYFSPCGVVLDRDASLLMADPVRYFPYIAELCSPVREVLLVPFYQGTTAVGTVWVVAHDTRKHFDAEDARLVTSLTKFAGAAILTLSRIEAAERAELLQREREEHSERRRRLYETALSNTLDLVYVFDLEHRFTFANAALLALWNKSWDEAIGKTCLELGYEAWHAELHDAEIEQVRSTQRPIRGEVPFAGMDGRGRRVFEYIFVPVFGASGEVEAVAGTARDVTERQALENELREADRAKDAFIATLAHELRNPLAPISTGVSLLGEAKEPELTRKTLGVMRRQVDHMVRLIDDLLDVSRITRGKLELRRARIALADVIEAAIEGSQLQLDRGHHVLHRSLSAEPLYLDADQTRLAQVISNLLHNASKYTPNGGEVELSTRREGDEVVIAVRDSGLGIPEERLEDVFEMFSQVNRALDRAHGGLGIGLALVRRLVQMHGGSVSAHSEGVGRGSTFSVRLPLAQGEAVQSAPQIEATPEPVKGTRVLVVDDNEDAAELLLLALESAGYDAVTAHDGPGALATAEQKLPSIVILDIGLPGISGYDLARHFRRDARFAQTVLIALTGWGSQEDRRKALAAGFDIHLTKPVSARDLHNALGRAATLRANSAAQRA